MRSPSNGRTAPRRTSRRSVRLLECSGIGGKARDRRHGETSVCDHGGRAEPRALCTYSCAAVIVFAVICRVPALGCARWSRRRGCSSGSRAPRRAGRPRSRSRPRVQHRRAAALGRGARARARRIVPRLERTLCGLAAAHPESAFLAWRIARNHWRRGERLPLDAKHERLAAFTARSGGRSARSRATRTAASRALGDGVDGPARYDRRGDLVGAHGRADGRADRARHRAPADLARQRVEPDARQHLPGGLCVLPRGARLAAFVDLRDRRARKQGARARLHRARGRDRADAHRLSGRARGRVVLPRRRARARLLARGGRGRAGARDAAPASARTASIRRMPHCCSSGPSSRAAIARWLHRPERGRQAGAL